MDHLALPVEPDVLDSLGWRSGDVVGIEPLDGRLEVHRLLDPGDPSLTTVAEDGIPVPPHWLTQMVAGTPSSEAFIASGHRVARLFGSLIEQHLATAGVPAVIDFGCGCGRVARALPRYIECELAGCDITTPAIEWCRKNLRGEYFESAAEPPLPVPDARFDSLYAVSVLTHLDEPHQDAWLREWQRIVRPGGLLLVTYRGEGFLARIDPRRREGIERLLEPGGIGFMATDHWEGLFPDYYGGAFHRDAYVKGHWGRFFDVLELRPAGDTGLVQDLAVLRRQN
jgi:SAM-dependent methyltransferase